jgi:hypothetical protein
MDWGLYRDKAYLAVHFVETTRGCPLDCEFCAVTTFFGGRYRNRPLTEEQLQEGYLQVFRETYAKPCMIARMQKSTCYRPFFVPANFGFRDAIECLDRKQGQPAVESLSVGI